MAPAVTGRQGTLLLTPDNEEEFLTCNVGHNATFVLELQGGVPLHAIAVVLAMLATSESPILQWIPWDLHDLIRECPGALLRGLAHQRNYKNRNESTMKTGNCSAHSLHIAH